MNPVAIILVLGSATIHAWLGVITKRSHDKQIFTWLVCLAAVVILFPIFVYEAAQGHVTGKALLVSAAAGIIHSLYWYLMSRAYEGGDLSHVYPIIRSAPGLIFIISVLFLHEHVSPPAVIGILTIMFGIYMINMKKFSFGGFLEPLGSFRERHTRFAFLTMLAAAAYSLQDKQLVQHVNPLLYSYLLIVFPTLYWTPFILKTKTRTAIVHEWKKSPSDVLQNAIIAFISYTLILYALTLERVSYVVSLRQISIVISVLLGGHLLKERNKWIRLGAALLIFMGTMLIAFSE